MATWTEWAIRYGDGEIDDVTRSEQAAAGLLRVTRERIAAGEVAADDYEPMTVVKRQVTRTYGEWEDWS